mmetsp:Transcript_89/g.314  ORF Transcript_89/g.314 Transcript_89/m.314 type:complete len:228 (+) Transcript_89:149-832(+)
MLLCHVSVTTRHGSKLCSLLLLLRSVIMAASTAPQQQVTDHPATRTARNAADKSQHKAGSNEIERKGRDEAFAVSHSLQLKGISPQERHKLNQIGSSLDASVRVGDAAQLHGSVSIREVADDLRYALLDALCGERGYIQADGSAGTLYSQTVVRLVADERHADDGLADVQRLVQTIRAAMAEEGLDARVAQCRRGRHPGQNAQIGAVLMAWKVPPIPCLEGPQDPPL